MFTIKLTVEVCGATWPDIVIAESRFSRSILSDESEPIISELLFGRIISSLSLTSVKI